MNNQDILLLVIVLVVILGAGKYLLEYLKPEESIDDKAFNWWLRKPFEVQLTLCHKYYGNKGLLTLTKKEILHIFKQEGKDFL